MGSKVWIPLVISLALGLVAAFVARNAMQNRAPQRAASGSKVAVAIRDIETGAQISAADVDLVSFPPNSIPARSFSSPADLVGRVNVVPVIKGQPLVDGMLAPKGAPAGLQSLVPPGMRALTIEVNEYSGLAGMLTPGARVDVIANIRDDRTHETASRTIVQNVQVTAVGRQLSAPATTPGQPPAPPSTSVTLLVTPQEAQTLQLASQSGRPWLALRGYGDTAEFDAGVTSFADLRGFAEEPTPLVKVDDTVPTVAVLPTTLPAQTTTLTTTPVTTVAVTPKPERVREHITLIQGGVSKDIVFDVKKPESKQPVADSDSGTVVPNQH